jgi:signal transduction histidine kinase
MSQIEAQAKEAAAIVADLIVSARADTTPVTVLARTVDAGLLCREALAVISGADDISIDVKATAMWADPGLTRRIVSSLVSNAIRYGGTTVRVETTSSGPDTVIQVINDGPAIPFSERERLFSGDLRSGQPVTQPAAVGLGLTVARHLARQMDGDVTYRRTGDGHNVFELRLPSEPYAPAGLGPVPIPA